MLLQTPEYLQWLALDYVPIMGADDDDDNDDTTSGDNDNDDANDTSTTTTASGDDDNDDDSTDDDNQDDADVEELDRVKRERDEARDKLARAEHAAQKAKDEAREARKKAASKDGNWEAVAKEREAELQEANEKATNMEQRAIKAEEDLEEFRREVRITRMASQLHFRDTEDAMAHMAKHPEEASDDKSCLRSLKKLAERKPYLIDTARRRQRELAGDNNGGGGLAFEDLKNLSPEEINASWEKGGVQTALQNAPRPNSSG